MQAKLPILSCEDDAGLLNIRLLVDFMNAVLVDFPCDPGYESVINGRRTNKGGLLLTEGEDVHVGGSFGCI